MNQPIIDPVDTALIEQELTRQRFLRPTNKGNNEIYVVTAHDSPNTMREIGRLREIAFRTAGGGTGLECDIDRYDTMPVPCRQLIVWDPDSKLILGGYRYICGRDIVLDADNKPMIATSHMFRFSQRFLDDYLPYTIELGRSFVRIEAQATRQNGAIFALDNLWDGLGALTVKHPEVRYLFGKVTMYPDYKTECRDMILDFFRKHFADPDSLVVPIVPLEQHPDREVLDAAFPPGGDFKEDYKRLNRLIRDHGFNIPPLVNAYMTLSPTMRYFGTAINPEFGDVEESGILVTVDEIAEEKKRRHIESFTDDSRTPA